MLHNLRTYTQSPTLYDPSEDDEQMHRLGEAIFELPEAEQVEYVRKVVAAWREANGNDEMPDFFRTIAETAPDDEAIRRLAPALTQIDVLEAGADLDIMFILDRLRPVMSDTDYLQLVDQLTKREDPYYMTHYADVLAEQGDVEPALYSIHERLIEGSYATDDPSELYFTFGQLANKLINAGGKGPNLVQGLLDEMEEADPIILLEYYAELDLAEEAVSLIDRHEKLHRSESAYWVLYRHANTYPEQARRLANLWLKECRPVRNGLDARREVRALNLMGRIE
jgi:hypothetical protein